MKKLLIRIIEATERKKKLCTLCKGSKQQAKQTFILFRFTVYKALGRQIGQPNVDDMMTLETNWKNEKDTSENKWIGQTTATNNCSRVAGSIKSGKNTEPNMKHTKEWWLSSALANTGYVAQLIKQYHGVRCAQCSE